MSLSLMIQILDRMAKRIRGIPKYLKQVRWEKVTAPGLSRAGINAARRVFRSGLKRISY